QNDCAMQFFKKFADKAEKDPLVPLGCAATLTCLCAGLYAFLKGHANLSQKLMRARVVAQAATVAVFLSGSLAVSKMRTEDEKRPPGMSKVEFDLLKREDEAVKK
ncbi:hypothetical protein CTAYLR_006772, partial [Chrysophaeum taylorii]